MRERIHIIETDATGIDPEAVDKQKRISKEGEQHRNFVRSTLYNLTDDYISVRRRVKRPLV